MASRNHTRSSPLFLLAVCAWMSACGGTTPTDPRDSATPTDPTVVVQPPTTPPPSEVDPVDPASPAEPASPSVSVRFAVAAQDGSLQPATTTSILATAAMYVVADWRDLPADAVEQLALIAPSGSLYLSPSFSLADGQGATLEALADGTVRATYRVGIWGTSIASYRRTGSWTATASLVGGTATAAATIDLTP